jgi:hypothetical protein
MNKLKKLFDLGWIITGKIATDNTYILKATLGHPTFYCHRSIVSNENLEEAINQLYEECVKKGEKE